MALTKQIEMVSNFGDTVVFNDAYIKVTEIKGNKNNIICTYVVYMGKEKQTGLTVSTIEFTPNLDGDNFIKQGYEYIKSLPEYSDAIDC